MKILLAKDAGYCFGVRDAVDMAYNTAEKHDDVYMLGHIVFYLIGCLVISDRAFGYDAFKHVSLCHAGAYCIDVDAVFTK